MDINNKERMYTDKILPLTKLEQQWIIDITVNYFGINQRVVNLLKELNETPYRQEVVTEKMREIALNDLWFYRSRPEADRAIKFIISLFNIILHKGLNYQNKKRFLDTLSEFIKSLYDEKSEEINYESLGENLIIFLEDIIYTDKELKIFASSFFKKIPADISHNDIHLNRLKIIIRAALWENLILWQKILNYASWCNNKDKQFFEKYRDSILRITQEEKKLLKQTEEKIVYVNTYEEYLNINDFEDFKKEMYVIKASNKANLEQIYFVFYILEMPEMIGLRKSFLNELAFLFKTIQLETFDNLNLDYFLSQLFFILNRLKEKHMEAITEVLLSLGKKVYQTKNKINIKIFNNYLIGFGFVYPGELKINQDWQIESNSNHIKMIRLYLELIKCSTKDSTELIKALIINLKIGGLFVQDNDLFQRDISQLLASGIEPNYFLIKQLASLFPVYYNDIGAEGEIREISTNVDKISYGSDSLIHFLRKQVHSESNNTQAELIRNILYFWYDKDIFTLEKILPDDVQRNLRTSGKWFDPVHRILKKLCDKMNIELEMLLEEPIEKIESYIEKNDQVNKKRVLYTIELYQLIKHKYSSNYKSAVRDLMKSNFFNKKEVKLLKNNIELKKYAISIKKIYSMLLHLKTIILKKEKTEVNESIYYKRHIASGIPSMYGKYSERKFEALGLMLRLEKLANYLINEYINQRNLNYMTINGFHNAAKILRLIKDGLMIEGISSENFNSNLEMLNYSFKTTTFSMGQFVNIFYFLTLNIKEIIDSYYIFPFSTLLKIIINKQTMEKDIINKEKQKNHFVHKKSEEFYRDMIVSAFLIQNLDNYVSKILETLRNMTRTLKPEVIHMLLKYNPQLLISSFNQKEAKVDNQIFLGAKAYYLKKLYSYKFPVPPGFILTTEWFRERTAIVQFPEMYKVIREMIRNQVFKLEKLTGKKFGDPNDPLLLSVRSGTVIPMPGAMDTILNIGMNDNIAEQLSKKEFYSWAAWDSYRRLLQQWGMAHEIVRDEFDKIILDFKSYHKITEKKAFSKEQMKSIAFSYKDLLMKHGVILERDPFKQLLQAIVFVFNSWYNDRARLFRKKLQIAEEWGTAVIVQEMVLGNIDVESGTGVIFTKIPFEKSSEVAIYGDFTQQSQGEDIVSGLVYALPVSEFQNKKFPHLRGNSLEEQFPEIYQELLRLSKELVYQRGYEHQEIEFTFKSRHKEDLFILQTRQYSIKDNDKTSVFKDPAIDKNLVGTGIGIGKGVINGVVAFDMEDLKAISVKYPGKNKILIRPDTVPDDIEMIFDCDGLLTARGGVASHAAVTAAQLGKVCVVNCKQLTVFEGEKRCIINDTEFKTGDEIAIDSNLGDIYKGNYPTTMEKIQYF
jgi:pyruvate, orthophosphate dikinase